MAAKGIGFISTRLAGTDGVSLETRKWAEVLSQEGHQCFFMAGELDYPEEVSFLVPDCHFINKKIWSLHEGCFDRRTRSREVTVEIDAVKRDLKDAIYAFVERFDIELLIPENANAIPYNIPLGLAITEFSMETGIKMIAHHHDFFWERKRFLSNACWDYLSKAFPPNLFSMSHVVLNSSQRHQLSLRRGISAEIIPNVMDFDTEPDPPNGYANDLRQALGIGPDEVFVLQPTRIVQRKGIEHAIEFVHRLKRPAVLVISHAAGDEGNQYYNRVLEYSDLLGVKTVYCADNVRHERGTLPDGRKIYRLADLYHEADLVTYPSEFEGFGNAFLEAVYFRRPIVVNNYSAYNYDIKPKGFKTIEMDGYVDADTVRNARAVLDDGNARAAMVEHNRELAKHYFSYRILRQKLCTLMVDCFGS
jgi:mannosylglucosylglycerate synthase